MEHCHLFTEAVRSGDWSAFMATIAPDAVRQVQTPDSSLATFSRASWADSDAYRLAHQDHTYQSVDPFTADDEHLANERCGRSYVPGPERLRGQAYLYPACSNQS